MSKIIIGLHGPIGSGKDTLARGMRSELGPNIGVFKFAGALYNMAAQLDPAFDPNMSHAEKESPLLGRPELGSRRSFIDRLGTQFGRDVIDKDLWIKVLQATIERSSVEVAIISDVRFPNEAAWVRSVGTLIHLQPDWVTVGADSKHVSNTPLEVVRGDIQLGLRKGYISHGLEALSEFVQGQRLKQASAPSKPSAT